MNRMSIPAFASAVTVLVALLVALTASAALAANISCPNRDNNLCVGTDERDVMQGSLGNDIMRGYGGNDEMIGGLGDDTVHATDGNDDLEGRVGNDYLNGGDGNDTILTADGRDEAYGGSGDDVIRASRDDQVDFINCGTGYDIADVQSGDNVDGTRAGQLVATTVTSCERIIVNGLVVIDRPI